MKMYRWIVTGLLCMMGIGVYALTRIVDIDGTGQYTSIQTAINASIWRFCARVSRKIL